MKNNIFVKLFIAIGVIISVNSCDKDDCGFNGNDNHIISFDLTVSGVTYKGAVTDDQIVMSVPEGLSLRNATANVVISENAGITPDPAGITDWDAEEQFVVTSHNNGRRSYIYRLKRASVVTAGNVILTNQAEVDAFAGTGVSVIDGNLIIGKTTSVTAADSIRDLSGLGCLRQVVHNITINNTYAGKDLSGLTGIEKTGGLKIGNIASLTDIYFPELTTIGTQLSISSVEIKEVKMPELAFVGESFLVRGDSLRAVDFKELVHVGGDMTFNGTNSNAENNTMNGAVSFPALETIGGSMTISKWPRANELELPLLKSVAGTIMLTSLGKINVIELPLLEHAGGLNLNTCAALAKFDLPVLKTFDGAVAFSSLPVLGNLFMNSLVEIKGNLTLNLPAATGVSFPGLEAVEGTLSIPATASNLVMPYFPKLAYIGKDLDIRSPKITDLTGFAALEEIGARLYLQNATGLISLSDLGSLKKVGGSYYLYGLTNLTEVDVRGIDVPEINIYLTTWTNLRITGDDVFNGKLNLSSPPANLSAMPEMTGFKTIGSLSISTGSYTGPVGLGGVEAVTGLLDFSSSNYCKVIGMPDLKKAGGIKFNYNNSLTTIDLPELHEITGYTDVQGKEAGDFNYPATSNIANINLPKLKKVKGNFSVTGLTAPRPLKGINMPLIESVTGTVTITGTNNPNFVSLGNFSNLTVAGGVAISGFTNLVSFEGFVSVVSSLDESAWKITGCGYNPTYLNMTEGQYNKP